jgi:hypothetical protein
VLIHKEQLDAAGILYGFVSYDGVHEIHGETLARVAADLGRG